MSLSETNIRERKFHDELHSSGQERSQNKFYRALYSLNEDFRNLLKVKTKSVQVLDYGCGAGGFKLALNDLYIDLYISFKMNF